MPADWAYLALAHAQKGNFAEAQPVARSPPHLAPGFVGDLLGPPGARPPSERGRVVLFDAEFPRDPFQGREAEMNRPFRLAACAVATRYITSGRRRCFRGP